MTYEDFKKDMDWMMQVQFAKHAKAHKKTTGRDITIEEAEHWKNGFIKACYSVGQIIDIKGIEAII